MPPAVSVRLLTVADLPQALELSDAAGWNQTAADWLTLLDLAPSGCFGLHCGQRLVSTATLVCHGSHLAWIGMVLTQAEYQRRGFARTLMLHALDLAAARGVATVKLDATDRGRPLYEALGFRPEQAVERWGREGSPPSASVACADPMVPPIIGEDWLAADATASGYHRAVLLRRLATRSSPLFRERSYLLHRPGIRAHYLGPCVADSANTASSLMQHALHRIQAKSYFWDLLPANNEAVELACRLGFKPVRQLTRMVYGDDLRPKEESRVYAIAGFEWG